MADTSFLKIFMATNVANLLLYELVLKQTSSQHWTGAQHWQ